MIHSVTSSLPTFKNLTLRPGLNILVADKDPQVGPDKTQKLTRNSAGKSSLIEIAHFVLGAKLDKEAIFKKPALAKASFSLSFDVGGHRLTATRSADKHGRIFLDGDFAGLPITPVVDRETGVAVLSLSDWKKALGAVLFGVQGADEGDDDADDDDAGAGRGRPSFRALIAYFIRRVYDGGFFDAASSFNKQSAASQQVNLSFLLGLDWSIPLRLQAVKQQLNDVRTASRKDGIFSQVLGSADAILRELAITEDRANKLAAQLAQFQVIPQYYDLRQEAEAISRRQAEINAGMVANQATIRELEEALQNENLQAPDLGALHRLYEEAQVALPATVKRRFEEVRSFHESVVRNRRTYLEEEIGSITKEQERLSDELGRISKRYQEVMLILKTGGALEQYLRLQEELSRAQALAETLRHRHRSLEDFSQKKVELDIQRKQLALRLSRDFTEQEDAIKHAINTFERFSSALYHREEAGTFNIRHTENGPSFEVKLPAARKGGGKSKMGIFCFDLMLTQLLHERGRGPGVLVHDSHLFDGVDSRQTASALALGAKVAEELGLQYLVTMNSDAIPALGDRPPGFDPEMYILPTRLRDTEESGGLFGFRFD